MFKKTQYIWEKFGKLRKILNNLQILVTSSKIVKYFTKIKTIGNNSVNRVKH